MYYIIDKIRNASEDDNSPYSLRHLQHVFEGYRLTIIQGEEVDNFYSKGSARAKSFELGMIWAKMDLAANSSLAGKSKEELRAELEKSHVDVDRLLAGVHEIIEKFRE